MGRMKDYLTDLVGNDVYDQTRGVGFEAEDRPEIFARAMDIFFELTNYLQDNHIERGVSFAVLQAIIEFKNSQERNR